MPKKPPDMGSAPSDRRLVPSALTCWRSPMQRASETIGAIAASLAKAQCELDTPERTLTATITDRGGERSFRYASLASGLDLVRKALGQQDIAVMQTTAVEKGQIMLTTL